MILPGKGIWHAVAVAMAFGLAVGSTQAEEESLKSGWLDLVKGFRGDAMGAMVVDIVDIVDTEEGSATDFHRVTVAIPKTSLSHPDTIEEVVVIGQKPKKSEPLDISYEWLSDYDKDNYGLVIRLSKDTQWPIRLYMSSDAGFTP